MHFHSISSPVESPIKPVRGNNAGVLSKTKTVFIRTRTAKDLTVFDKIDVRLHEQTAIYNTKRPHAERTSLLRSLVSLVGTNVVP